MNPLTIAYELGYHAGINGEDPRLCPYPKMTAEAQSWHQAQRHGANVRQNALSFCRHYEVDRKFKDAAGQ